MNRNIEISKKYRKKFRNEIVLQEIDVLPDVMEKAIYKKCLKIIMAMTIEMKDKL